MKKYLSVFALPARRTLPRLLLILIAMAAVQIALFSAALTKAVDAGGDFPLLEDVVADRPHRLDSGRRPSALHGSAVQRFRKKSIGSVGLHHLPAPRRRTGLLLGPGPVQLLRPADPAGRGDRVRSGHGLPLRQGSRPGRRQPSIWYSWASIRAPCFTPAAAGRHSDPCGKSLHASGSGPLRGALRQDAEPGKI